MVQKLVSICLTEIGFKVVNAIPKQFQNIVPSLQSRVTAAAHGTALSRLCRLNRQAYYFLIRSSNVLLNCKCVRTWGFGYTLNCLAFKLPGSFWETQGQFVEGILLLWNYNSQHSLSMCHFPGIRLNTIWIHLCKPTNQPTNRYIFLEILSWPSSCVRRFGG